MVKMSFDFTFLDFYEKAPHNAAGQHTKNDVHKHLIELVSQCLSTHIYFRALTLCTVYHNEYSSCDIL